MKKKGHLTTDDKTGDKYHINLTFVLSTYKILIQIDNNYQLDLRNSKFGELIGFTEKIVNKTIWDNSSQYHKFHWYDLYKRRRHYEQHIKRR